MDASYILLANLRAGHCSNTAEVRLLRFWEARNIRKCGELMSIDMLLVDEEELKRFPTLASDIAAAANEAPERFRDESRKTVLRLVDMESSYLTVEFFRKLHLEPEKRRRSWEDVGRRPTAHGT